MPQSLSNVIVHLVFSTKNRNAWLRNPELRREMFKFIAGSSNSLDCPAIRCGGHEDHIHLLARLSRTSSIADWVKELKRVSSVWIKEKIPALADFHWQAGYGVFSVSQSKIDAVCKYIDSQEEHHKRISFQDEFREMLRLHEIEFDERYIWD